MHSTGWRLVLVAVLVAPSLAAAPRVTTDDDWCREESRGHGRRYCEVREVSWPARGEIAVDARPNGGVAVRGWDRDEVRLRVKVVATAGDEAEARAIAEQVQIETTGTVRAVGPDRDGEGRGWWASFRLDVPRGAALNLEADNGGLHLEDLAGVARLRTVNGGIHLARVGGDIRGETVNGGVHLALSGDGWNGEGLDLRTTNGGLHIEVPAGYNARLQASTVNGGVHGDVGRRTRGTHGHTIETDLGRGGALLKVATTNGGLHLNRR